METEVYELATEEDAGVRGLRIAGAVSEGVSALEYLDDGLM